MRNPIRIGLALGLLGALLHGQQAEGPDVVKNPLAGNAAAVAAGKDLFEQTCSACHGADAQGGRGPSLASGEFSHGGEDADLFHTIHEGISGTQMPSFPALSNDDTWRIITFLRSLNPTTGSKDEVITGDPKAGEELFWNKAKCGQCHEVNGRGSIVGPDLSEAGKSSAEQLEAKIVNPNAPVGRGFRRGVRLGAISITLRSGETIIGMRRAEDEFTLLMTDMNGNLRRFDHSVIAEEHDLPKSLMPDNYTKTFATVEIQNIVAYLETLKVRDVSNAPREDVKSGVTYEELRNAHSQPRNWLTYWGDYQGTHFSRLNQIDKNTVKMLQAKWSVPMPSGPLLEVNPIVVNGIMYATYTASEAQGAYALDARSGLVIWKYERRQKKVNPYQTNPFNRGVAVLGDRVFFGTLDGALVALDARTGRTIWETQVANTMEGYSITAAPLALKGEVIVGVAGGEFGIRGFLDAYDAVTGKLLWRFYTIPGPGEPGNNTWSGDSWMHGSGATWLTGSYDPDLNLLYWAAGNPGPDIDASVRQGDNLYTCSVIALDPDTGKLKWYYQFTPNDTHDWDANEDLILADAPIDGVQRKLLLQADRNGFYYVLDRTDGKFIFAKPYVKQTWNLGFKSDGSPILADQWKASPEGTLVSPGGSGGADWQDPSYDAARSRLFVVAVDGGPYGYRSGNSPYEAGRVYMGGRPFQTPVTNREASLTAIDTRTGDVKWRYRTLVGSLAAGDLATAGGLVFTATGDGDLIAIDSDEGKSLWHFQAGAPIASAPISYAVDGKQYVAISAGNVLYSFALPD